VGPSVGSLRVHQPAVHNLGWSEGHDIDDHRAAPTRVFLALRTLPRPYGVVCHSPLAGEAVPLQRPPGNGRGGHEAHALVSDRRRRSSHAAPPAMPTVV
jgi:hypothetical protein